MFLNNCTISRIEKHGWTKQRYRESCACVVSQMLVSQSCHVFLLEPCKPFKTFHTNKHTMCNFFCDVRTLVERGRCFMTPTNELINGCHSRKQIGAILCMKPFVHKLLQFKNALKMIFKFHRNSICSCRTDITSKVMSIFSTTRFHL